jgi:hypothetical protein
MAIQPFLGPWSLFQFLDPIHSRKDSFGRVVSPSQGLYLQTGQHKLRINAHNTDSHASSGIATHDPSDRASEDSSCLRSRGHCDRRILLNINSNLAMR